MGLVQTPSPVGATQLGKTTKTDECGTLTYTTGAIAVLFFWLLWGDVCYTLMESVTGPIMLLKFKALGATNTEYAFIGSTCPGLVYTFVNPIVSFKSDRFRSRLGRRIPFLIFSLPFLVMGLVGLALGDRFGFWLQAHLHIASLSPNRAAILTLGMLLILFTFFNTFVTSTFWYLFRDVVPERLLARFMSWFRVIGTVSASFYSFCIFPYSGTHSTAIFMGAAVIYLAGFGLMCLNVREGQYPPPPLNADGQGGPIATIKSYAQECHSHKLYWYLWLCTFIGGIGGGVGMFDLYFKQAIGLDLAQIGRIAGTNSIIISGLILGSGWLADRFHPIRVVLAAQILAWMTTTPASLIWLFWHPARDAMWTFHLPVMQYLPLMHQFSVIHIQKVFLISFVIYVGLAAPVAALSAMWDPVLIQRIFPTTHLGQFCSTNAIWRTLGGMLGGLLAGGFLDLMTRLVGRDRAYFYNPVWSICFAVPSFILFLKFYQSWKRHGGDDSYVAPLPVAPVLESVQPSIFETVGAVQSI
jgi:maltose/moltooligosaccharide transporter